MSTDAVAPVKPKINSTLGTRTAAAMAVPRTMVVTPAWRSGWAKASSAEGSCGGEDREKGHGKR